MVISTFVIKILTINTPEETAFQCKLLATKILQMTQTCCTRVYDDESLDLHVDFCVDDFVLR